MAQQLVPLPAEVRLVPGSQWERRRRESRYHCSPATLGTVAAAALAETRHGWVLNLSVHGAGVLITQPLDVGTLIVLQIKSNSGDRTYELPGRVVHATTQPTGDWLVGCEFADILTPDDLDVLL